MNQTIEIYLLEDDPVFLQRFSQALEAYLRQHRADYRLHCYSCGEALLSETGDTERIDLLITDICLSSDGITGLGVAGEIRSRFPDCSIIFLTAFLEYATEIYDTRPLYFILKEEYQKRIPAAMELFFQNQTEKQTAITILSGRTSLTIRLEDILYCEHVGRKTKIVCTDRQLLVTDTIDALAARLPRKRFFVCHKGYIINFDYLASFRRYTAELSTGQEVPISRSRYDGFRAAYASYLAN